MYKCDQIITRKEELKPGERAGRMNKLQLSRTALRGEGVVDNVTHPSPQRGVKRGPYRKRKRNEPKRIEDFIRYSKSLEKSFYNNFPQNNLFVHWVTLTYKDQRVKSISKAKNDLKNYIRKLNVDVIAYTAVIELDINHHPHIHVMIFLSSLVGPKFMENSWQHGFARDKQAPDNFPRIINYLVKLYSDGESLSYSLAKAQSLDQQERRLKCRIEALTGNKATRRIKKDYLYKEKYHVHQLKKAECQKEFTGNDSPIVKSRNQKNYMEVSNPSNSLCSVFQEHGIYQYSLVTYYTYFDSKSKTVKKVLLNRKDIYTFPEVIHKKLLYLMELEGAGIVAETA